MCLADCLSLREWFLNGNYLIIIVSACVILPLALMRQLGTFPLILFLSHFCSVFPTRFTITPEHQSDRLPGSEVCQCLILLSPCRLPGLHQRFLPHLHGVLPHLGEPPKWTQKISAPPAGQTLMSRFDSRPSGYLQEIQHPVSAGVRARERVVCRRRPPAAPHRQQHGRLLRGQTLHRQLSGRRLVGAAQPFACLLVRCRAFCPTLSCVNSCGVCNINSSVGV